MGDPGSGDGVAFPPGNGRRLAAQKLRNEPDMPLIQHDFPFETKPITVAERFLAPDDAEVGPS